MADETLLKTNIIAEVTTITQMQSFTTWLSSETIPANGNSFIAINNSFLFRDDIKTIKSKKFIAFDISPSKIFNLDDIYIVTGISFNRDFQRFQFVATDHIKTDLSTAITDELNNLGEVVYVLVGDIQDTNEFSEKLTHQTLKFIKLNPTLATDFLVQGNEIIIREYSDREQIWQNIETYCNGNSINIPDNFASQIEKAITSFENKAYSNLNIPTTFDTAQRYLLDKIHQVIEEHLTNYRQNLSAISTDNKAMNEILRISYNFVSDVNKLLILLINVCDLKPIILWTTISKFYELDQKFKDLPFGFSKMKPSLNNYQNLIKNARNRSFHQLFPFNKALKFQIQSIQDVNVTLFSSYSKKDDNKITYKDQELYDLLTSFTRVNEQIVSSNFWTKNELVMTAISNLILAVSQSIKSTR